MQTVWLSLSRLWMVAGLPHCCRIGQAAAGAVVRHGIIARRRGHARAPHLSRFLELDARSFKHWRHFWTVPCGRTS
ncbi:MAG TPA: hypothetical protein VKJ47_09885 [Candidatus Binatia bacterium]|nr:hypothetical protein [Candidatus Binatia bacterium]